MSAVARRTPVGAWRPFLIAALLSLLAPAVRAQEIEPSLFGRSIMTIELTGTAGSQRLLGQVPLRAKGLLTRQGLQHGVRVLYRSGRFARVSAWAEEDESGRGVHVRFDVEPIRKVLRVSFVGARELSDSRLTRAAELAVGTEFSPARITQAAAAIASAYFRAGFRDAQVRWDAVPAGDGLAVDFSLAEGDPTTLVRLEFLGDRGLTEPELQAAFDLPARSRLMLDQVDRGIAELRNRFRRRGFYRARVGQPQVDAADGRAVLGIPLEAGPRFRLQVRGARAFDDRLLLAQLHYGGEEVLDASLQRDLAERLRTFYEFAGFAHAKVTVRESAPPRPREAGGGDGVNDHPRSVMWPDPIGIAPRPLVPQVAPDERVVTFLIDEGPPVRVIGRVYQGLKAFAKADLDQRFDVALEDSVPPVLVRGRDDAVLAAARVAGGPGAEPRPRRYVQAAEVYAHAPYRNACSQIADLYKSQGYLDAKVGPAYLEMTGQGSAVVLVPIDEGRRTMVASVELAGVAQLPRDEVLRAVTVRPGDPLSFFAVEESRAAIASLYQGRGHLFAQVEDDEEIDDSSANAKVFFKVQEGPVVRVSRIELKGLARTSPELVREAVRLDEGDPITPQARQDSVRNLMKSGLFTSATVDPADPELVEAEKVLVVEVREKPSINTDLALGASLADGPRVSGQAAFGNLFGRNYTIAASLKLNYPFPRYFAEFPANCVTCTFPDDPLERRANLSLMLPVSRGAESTPLDLRFDLVHENLLRPAYQLTRYAFVSSIDGLVRKHIGPGDFTLLVQLDLENDRFRRRERVLDQFDTVADRKAQLLPEGQILIGSLRPAATFDARNDKINATSGFIASIAVDWSKSIVADRPDGSAFNVHLLRFLGAASVYVPVSRLKVVLAFSGRFGAIVKREGSEVIGTKRFFLGGTQSLRGFNEDALFPEDVRRSYATSLRRCESLASGLGCDERSRALRGGQVEPTQGGTFLVSGRAEVRRTIFESMAGAVFVDAGNLWFDPDAVSDFNLRWTTGVGLRIALPIGPLAVDLGVNLDPDEVVGEPLLRPHFSIGLF